MNLFSPAEIAANYAEAGVKKSSLPISKMLLLGVLAGMLIAFPSCVTNMASYGLDNNSTIRAISGLLFAFGLGMVILIGAELFTGNTLICISVLEKKVRVGVMLRNWYSYTSATSSAPCWWQCCAPSSDGCPPAATCWQPTP